MSKDLLIGLRHVDELPRVPATVPAVPLSHVAFTLHAAARFAKWNPSETALDLVARRLTSGEHDWTGIRAALISAEPRPVHPALDKIATEHLFVLWDAIGSSQDIKAEAAIARQIAHRYVNGDQINEKNLIQLASGLLNLGCVDEARVVTGALERGSWSRIVADAELAHPRFGGSHAAVIDHLNEAYRAADMLQISLTDGGGSPFNRLTASSERTAHGPLVSVIMSAWHPGDEIFTAVQSVINQTYQDWELLIMDDASGDGYDDRFAQLCGLDSRIRVIRNDENAGTYVRRNEALQIAIGDFATFHDSDDWSHPERLEIQVRDLIEHPGRIGNIVRHARATEDLSFATNRGMSLTLTEPAIMFRRREAISAAGFYDSIRKGADREYRLRLESVTGSKVETIGPMAPLLLMLASASSLSGSDFGAGWMTPARVAYRTASDRFHSLVREGLVSGRVEFPLSHRPMAAPPDLSIVGGAREAPVRVDVLVIVDGRVRKGRDEFLRRIALEIREALAGGLVVGLLHSDSLGGHHGGPRLAPALQTLVDEESVIQVFDGQPVGAEVVIIRHASAVQGHSAARRMISAPRALVVEDPAGGDARGLTFTVADVASIVTGWLGQAPGWGTIDELAHLAALHARVNRKPLVLATFRSPSAQLKYEDQVVAWSDGRVAVRYQRTFSTFVGADVVYGVGSMDAYLSLDAKSSPNRRLDRTRRFVKELVDCKAALVRTIFGELPEPQDPREVQARALLDEATTRFIVVEGSATTPDPARTVFIPFADPTPLFTGYPVHDQVAGRVLCATVDSLNEVAESVLRTFFVSRLRDLSLRIAGPASDSLGTELRRAVSRTPGKVTSRIELLSDAALIEEITAAEVIIVPEIVSPVEYQLAMTSLAFGRPVLTPSNDAVLALSAAVGDEWVIPIAGTLTAERLDAAVAQSRLRREGSMPDLRQRRWSDIGGHYEQVLRTVASEIRASVLDIEDSEIGARQMQGMDLVKA
ncbi:glycosyltransferase family 2 protein [Microbacterium protaetiae]|uniref:Glycosyltransferase family 2 protein n=1 Tax=Microbacterium protaetiae TaxID=2509458 RepID=A0A4P6EEK8_9MICO|nr:glycosyltransferase family A protein [Microbacterium protaetiae]QAY60614.1 glycosyltransferase family 2 protein [Microbacterium protaetiae]